MGRKEFDLFADAPLTVRETQYSPSSRTNGVYAPFIHEYCVRSIECFKNAPHQSLFRYGPSARHTIDLFLPKNPGSQRPPLLVFIHGGYWQELSRLDSAFAALDATAQGLAFAVLDYPLAPEAPLDEITHWCRKGITHLIGLANQGFDPDRIFLAGSSAGAHLAALLALRDWRKNGLLAKAIAGAILVSGIYLLRPLIGTSIDVPLGLSRAAADQLSPLLGDLQGFPETLIAWGEIETEAFKRQSLAFADAITAKGGRCRTLEIPGRNHFDVILDLARPRTALGAAVASLLKNREF